MSVSIISENMEEGQYSIPAMSTTDSLHPQHQYFQYYYSSPTINNTVAITQMSDINYGGVMSNTYCHKDPRVQGHQHSCSTTLDVDVNYEVEDYNQEDNDYELLSALINNHVENKEEEEEIVLPWQAAADDDVSSWEWQRFGGTLESIIDQAPCLVPPIIQHDVLDHGVHDHHGPHGNEVEEEEEEEEEEKDDHQLVVLLEDQEYCHMVPQVLADMKNTVVQSKHSMCNTEWMTVEEEDQHDQCYLNSNNSTPLLPPPPSPSYHSQREARKITEKRQMQRGKSSTTIPSSTNKRSKATIQSILHNKSERKRRSKINDRLEKLQKLLPNYNKTDKASMLDQVIEYIKKLQTQKDQMMNMRFGMFDNNNNMPVAVHPMMMMPHYITTMQQQQQQMSMMTQMDMGMCMNPAGLVKMPTGSIVHPNMRHE